MRMTLSEYLPIPFTNDAFARMLREIDGAADKEACLASYMETGDTDDVALNYIKARKLDSWLSDPSSMLCHSMTEVAYILRPVIYGKKEGSFSSFNVDMSARKFYACDLKSYL